MVELGPDREPVARGGQRADRRDRAEVPGGQAEPERADVQHSLAPEAVADPPLRVDELGLSLAIDLAAQEAG